MKNKTLNRRTLLKMGAVTAAGLTSANLISCSSEDNESGINREINPDIYRNSAKGSLAVKDVIKPIKGFKGKKPNFVVVLCDDMGYGDLGCYGSKAIKTPNLDKLAQGGVRFTDFHSCNALCSPSRAGLLTGRYPHRTGVTFPIWPQDDSFMRSASRIIAKLFAQAGALDLPVGKSIAEGLPPSEITIAEALKISGYTTAAIGKWHLGDFTKQPEYLPKNHGFDYFVGFNASNDDWPAAFWRNETEVIKDIQLDQERYTGLFTEEAVNFIERSKEKPFFLYLAHKDPHQPCIPSEKFKNSSDAGRHGDVVQEVDWGMGQIVDCLKRNNLEEDTIVIFTSDNGPWFDGSPGHHRGRKGQSFEGGFRVPMIASWPGNFPAGRTCSDPTMNIDFFPTLLEMAGLQMPNDRIIDGRSLGGQLSGKDSKPCHEVLFFFHENELEGVRVGYWKYFRSINHYVHPIPIDKPGSWAGAIANKAYTYTGKDSAGITRTIPVLGSLPILYNLKTDPGENYNVLAKHPDIGQQMLKIMEQWEKAFYQNPRGWISEGT